eukprot:scaffold3878_cov363-Prasinococcus_capsulatus_cf.AAC.8
MCVCVCVSPRAWPRALQGARHGRHIQDGRHGVQAYWWFRHGVLLTDSLFASLGVDGWTTILAGRMQLALGEVRITGLIYREKCTCSSMGDARRIDTCKLLRQFRQGGRPYLLFIYACGGGECVAKVWNGRLRGLLALAVTQLALHHVKGAAVAEPLDLFLVEGVVHFDVELLSAFARGHSQREGHARCELLQA